jgi:hypothetical protein
MKKVGEQLRRISFSTALCAALLVALPAAAGAQFMDPVLDQYAPSSQQIDKKVDGGDKGGGGDSGSAGAGDVQTDPATGAGEAGQGDGSDTDDSAGGGSAGGTAGGGDGTGGGTGASGTGASGGGASGGDGAATSSGSEGSGHDARLLTNVPLTRFDFLAFAIAIGLLIGTALLLRRLSRFRRVEG